MRSPRTPKVALGIAIASVIPMIGFAALWAGLLLLLGLMWLASLVGFI